MNIINRAKTLLSLDGFGAGAMSLGARDLRPPQQMVLRMMLKRPGTGLRIPGEVEWVEPFVVEMEKLHDELFPRHGYVYLTVRSGGVSTKTDDVWHVDGFSMRAPHLPEQNYIWSDCWPTEVLKQAITVSDDFDPMRHNIHWYFQDRADESKAMALEAGCCYVIDPYVIHRRPKLPAGTNRAFVRVSFVPIPIEDDRNTPNPLLPAGPFNRTDIRDTLIRYGRSI
jgi:hypothetical protein